MASSSASDRLPPTLRFMQVLWALVHGLERASKRMRGEVGITGPQRLVLRIVGLSPGTSAGELAATLRVHPSTLTGVLKRLERQRLLTRLADPCDGRRAVLRLTPRGRRANAIRAGTVEAAVAAALTASLPRDREAARRLIESIASRLERAPAGTDRLRSAASR